MRNNNWIAVLELRIRLHTTKRREEARLHLPLRAQLNWCNFEIILNNKKKKRFISLRSQTGFVFRIRKRKKTN